jgi:hypothetical protein
MENFKIVDSKSLKIIAGPGFNHMFNKVTGFAATWGNTKEEDPEMSPVGPLIADIEITTICTGINGIVCPFCYKANTPKGDNMSFETFKKVFDKLPKSISQIALGVDSHATSNPDTWRICEYMRSKGVIPNMTVAQIDDETADKISKTLGACAVSRYADKNVCYDSVKKLTDRGMTQCNIHIMASSQTYERIIETLQDRLIDPRLAKLNAIVILSLKQKGRGVKFTPLTQEEFNKIVKFALDMEIGIGFDSCSAFKFLTSVKDHKNFAKFVQLSEPCESTLFSVYVNTFGKFFPCSFTEGTEGWEEGLDIPSCVDFLKDVWYNPKTVEFRKNLLGTSCNNELKCRTCPVFNV